MKTGVISILGLVFLASAGRGVANAGPGYLCIGIGTARPTVDKASVQFHTRDWSPDVVMDRVVAGYQATDHFSLEGGYVQFGKARVATMGGFDYFEVKVHGFEITPIGSLPLGKGFSAFIRAGLVLWNSEVRYRYTALGSGTKKASGTGLLGSVGASYTIGRHLGARAEYSRYAIDKGKAGAGNYNAISLGLLIVP